MQQLTRTVCLIGLSRFLLSSYSQDKFEMVLASGYTHLHTIKLQYTLTVFWLRSTLYRDTAPVLPTKLVTGDKLSAPIKLCTATRVMLNKICTWTAKTRAKPSLHRDPSLRSGLLAKVPGFCPVLASGYAY